MYKCLQFHSDCLPFEIALSVAETQSVLFVLFLKFAQPPTTHPQPWFPSILICHSFFLFFAMGFPSSIELRWCARFISIVTEVLLRLQRAADKKKWWWWWWIGSWHALSKRGWFTQWITFFKIVLHNPRQNVVDFQHFRLSTTIELHGWLPFGPTICRLRMNRTESN